MISEGFVNCYFVLSLWICGTAEDHGEEKCIMEKSFWTHGKKREESKED